MIEFDGVAIRLGGSRVLEGLTVRCEPGELRVVTGLSALARVALVAAVAGIQHHDGAIRFSGGSSGTLATYALYSDAPLDPHADGYANVRMLAGRPVQRPAIEAIAAGRLDRGALSSLGSELTASQRWWLHLTAAVASGAENIVADAGHPGADPEDVSAFLRRAGCGAAVVLVVPSP